MVTRVLTTIILGVLVASFVAWLIIALYPWDESVPDLIPATISLHEQHDRNVPLIAMVTGLALVLAVRLSRRLPVISDGLLLGGILTLLYSIGLACDRSKEIAVIPIGIGLAVAILLAYDKFARTATSPASDSAPSE